jgi:integrase
MALSDTALRTAKPQATKYKLYDDAGLLVVITPTGGKLWRFKYRFGGTERQLSFGAYPDVSLKDARARRDQARSLIADGTDPGVEKKRKQTAAAIEAANTFKAIADEFVQKRVQDGMAEATMIKLRWFNSLLERDVGYRPVTEIEPVELLTAIKKIEKLGNHETAKRVRAFAARVFRYAVITGRCRFNPAADLGEALIVPKVKHHAALLEPDEVGRLLRAIDRYRGHGLSPLALKMLPHVFVRPGELRHAEWDEFDLGRAVWRIPAAKMKMRSDHAVPLSTQVLAILNEAALCRGRSKYVFPAVSSWENPMAENTLNVALTGRLGPLIEMATAKFACGESYPSIVSSPGGFKMAVAALETGAVSGTRARDYAGVFPLSKRSDGVAWDQWAKHAENAAANRSVPRNFAQRLIGALIELCDNVDEHSGRPETGIAAYAASEGKFEFVVADCGIGVLASLKRNPRFAGLDNCGAALSAAIRDGNSGLDIAGRGMGIGYLFRALIRDEGELRFRSGDYSLAIVGSSPTAEGSIQLSKQPWFDGLVISARCNPALSPDLFKRG